MKGLPGFGKPRRQRSLQYGYNTPPSYWNHIQNHSHLVIAGFGSLAFVVFALTAFWYALPQSDQSVAVKTVPQEMAAGGADIHPQTAKTPELATAPDAEPTLEPSERHASNGTQQTGANALNEHLNILKTDSISQSGALALMPEPAAPAIDPQAAAAVIVQDDEMGDSAALSAAQSSVPTTAAIPAPRPKPPSESGAKTATKAPAAGEDGRITSSVTFRSAPGGQPLEPFLVARR